MTDGQDWQLSQTTVDFRNEERRARWDAEPPDRPTPDEYQDLAFCTESEDCKAQVDGHLEGCPVDQRLRDGVGSEGVVALRLGGFGETGRMPRE